MIKKWDSWDTLCVNTGAFTSTVRMSPDMRKVVKVTPCESTKRNGILRDEMRLLLELDHPYVVKHTHLGQIGELVYIEMNFVGTSDLYDRVTSNLETAETKHRWLIQIAKAVEYLHSQDIAHMDIKLENILITPENDVKLIDFDFMIDVSDEINLNKYYRGSIPYMSPQVMDGLEYDPTCNDIWACGVLVYILGLGYMPFGENEREKITNAKYYNPPGPYRKIIMYTIAYSEKRRFTAPELVDQLNKIVIL